MVLATWLLKLPRKIWFQKRSINGPFLSEDAFRIELARERMRVDRNGSPLSILMIDLSAGRSEARDFGFLGHVLADRLRLTDTVGFLPHRRVGVLLPDTNKSGAWKVAADVCSVYPVGHDRPNCEVFVYPDDAPQPPDGDSEFADDPVGEASEFQIARLLKQKTPGWKRTIDVFGASIGLIFAAPMLLILAAAIKLTSRGPAFYSQEREGLGWKRFRIYKLRTMRIDAHLLQPSLRPHSEQDGPAFKMSRDPRTTTIGRWLRMTSLDELPQLWNVLRGDMSLVGPRPLPIDESLQCSPWQRQRLSVLPGLTCIWQIVGRNTVPFDEWMRMDLQYVRRQSFLYDIELLLRTPTSLVLQRGPR